MTRTEIEAARARVRAAIEEQREILCVRRDGYDVIGQKEASALVTDFILTLSDLSALLSTLPDEAGG